LNEQNLSGLGSTGSRESTEPVREQRRATSIAMSPEEMSAFLTEHSTCRVATSGAGGPHVSPMWFAWVSQTVWLYSLIRSQRWVDLTHDPRISVVIDAGEHSYDELRGVEVRGTAEIVGEVPRTEHDELAAVERAFARDTGAEAMHFDGLHAWLRIVPNKIVSWDFRKWERVTTQKERS
jgi:nitroimidazol reductase NimA-like FMN-containing flavoprotein (pyridoxamine 5'-phosphate oxidase superfamily)